ncbi:MAG: fibronectin type III domain-containing protein, partial [Myxococcaceae bacterium]|nr:fibronectin type III domain-containing protein [Myxococcaceae bacterium]
VEVDYRPDLELGDLVALSGNEVQFTSEQTGAVQSLTHTVNASTASTKLVLRGKPATSRRAWLSMEQRPGIAPPSPFTGPEAPSNLATSDTVQGFRLRFDPPTRGPAAASYELHVSTSNGFTPSSSTRRNTSTATEFAVTDLTPGTTYYARVVPRDLKGNRGTASAQATLTARYVEPGTLQPDVSVAQLPLNADFQAANVAGSPPDAWEVTAGTWGTDIQEETTTVYSGDRAVKFNETAVAARLTSGFFLLRPGDMIIAEASFYGGLTAYSSGNDAGVYLLLYDADFTLTSTTLVDSRDTGVASWLPLGRGMVTTIDVFASARYGRISVGKTAANAYAMLVDSARVFIFPRLENRRDPTLLNSWTNYTANNRDGARYYKDPTGHVHLEGMIQGGTVPSVAFNLPAGFRPPYTRDFAVVSAAGAGYVEIASGGNVQIITGSSTYTSLDGIRFRVTD